MPDRHNKGFIVSFPLFLSVILPCVHLYSIRSNPSFHVPVIDSMEYVKAAGEIAGGSLLKTETDHLSPLYTWFIASIFSVFGTGALLPVKLFQTLLNLGSAFLLYKTVYAVFSKREAVVSLYIWAFYGPIIFFTCEIISVSLILFMYNLSIYMIIRAGREKTHFWWWRTGVVLGFSVLARPDILIFLFILTAIIFFSYRGGCGGAPEKRTLFLWFVFGVTIPLAFASFVSYSASGYFRFLPADSGLNFYIGNNPDYAETIGARPGLFWDSLTEIPAIEGVTEAEVDKNQVYYSLVWKYLRDDFPGFCLNIAYKTLALFNGYELPSTLDIYTFGGYSPLLAALTWSVGWFSFPFGLLLPLAASGIWIHRRRKECSLPLLMFLSFFVSLIGFWPSSRYRMVLIPFLIFFASGAVVYFYGFFSGRKYRKNFAAFTVFIIFTVFSNVYYQHFSRNYNFKAEIYAFTGIYLAEREKKYEEALSRLGRSVDLQKQNDSDCSGYPFFLRPRNDCDKILTSYQASLKGHTYLVMADSYTGTGEYEKSLVFYKRAIDTGGVSFLAYNNLGTLMAKQGNSEEALKYFRRSIDLRPDYPVSHTDMGIALLGIGRAAEAVTQFSEVIRLGGDEPEAYYNLAAALVRSGAGQNAVVTLIKSLNLGPDRAMRVFVNMRRFRDKSSKNN